MNSLVDMLKESVRTGWWTAPSESKRWKAVAKVCRVLSSLNDGEGVAIPATVFFASEFETLGFAWKPNLPKGKALIYLAPTLEFCSDKDVEHTVAHELAHIFLGHHTMIVQYQKDVPHKDQTVEVAANKLAAEWGFPDRKRGVDGFEKVLGIIEQRAAKRRARPFDLKKAVIDQIRSWERVGGMPYIYDIQVYIEAPTGQPTPTIAQVQQVLDELVKAGAIISKPTKDGIQYGLKETAEWQNKIKDSILEKLKRQYSLDIKALQACVRRGVKVYADEQV